MVVDISPFGGDYASRLHSRQLQGGKTRTLLHPKANRIF